MSLRFLLGHVALPLAESAEGLGVGAPAADPPPTDDGGSLSEHEAAFVTPETPESTDDTPAVRDDTTGRFKPRHRAASQQADTDDIPTINAHTKRIKDAEARLGADIVKQSGESERAFTLRRRAELLERQAAAPAPVARREEPPPVVAAEPAKPAVKPDAPPEKFTFPTWEKFAEAHPTVSYDEWELERFAAYDAWKDARSAGADISARVREALAVERARLTVEEAVDATHAKGREAYPDFDTVKASGAGAKVNLGPDDATAFRRVALIYQHPQSEHLQYAIMKDGALAQKLAGLDDISFGLELATIVATQRPPSPRSAAVSTGSAPAPVRSPAPRPPNPGRTGSMHAADDPPGEDSSLAAHESFYVKPARR